MWETVEGISEEVFNSQKRFYETFNESCDELVSKLKKTQEFREQFKILKDRPYIIQKCSMHGILLVKEILSKAREEINSNCYEEFVK